MPGDDRLPAPDVVMDRAFDVPASPTTVWPWLVQLGKGRAGWYLPARVERALPRNRRALRRIDPRWQGLAVGDRIPDYGPDGYFDVLELDAPTALVFVSQRKATTYTWAITLTPTGAATTRVRLRLRIHPVRRRWLATAFGEPFDAATIAGLAAGLCERVRGR